MSRDLNRDIDQKPNDNNSPFFADHSTQGGTKSKDSTGYSWVTYDGNSTCHDEQATQINSKTYDGEHFWYCPKSGKQGWRGSNRN